ncbi:hypothetical protein [Enterococcus innesii]|uniref:hypothetical protein n=1 Tax=Enterococcus innesii TaxID=2839759 RepID=UPI002090B77F|nr:hypothetical protein [Enterococcus innesii]MCO5496787.1 hypothetical protein [Enterococcus innesii]
MEQQANDRQETDNSRLVREKRKLERLKRVQCANLKSLDISQTMATNTKMFYQSFNAGN